MLMIGLARLGGDAELRYTPDGKPVVNLSLAYDYGRKAQDGKRPTQWVSASFWGERAEKLAPYLLKGNQIVAHCSDVHVETYEKKDGGEGVKLVARLADIELVAGQRDDSQTRAPQPQQKPLPETYAKAAGKEDRKDHFSDIDSDIPF